MVRGINTTRVTLASHLEIMSFINVDVMWKLQIPHFVFLSLPPMHHVPSSITPKEPTNTPSDELKILFKLLKEKQISL